jgi:ribosome-associated translation inhibitor RaiA
LAKFSKNAGTNNFRTSTFTCHIKTTDHQSTLIPKDEQGNIQKAVDNLFDKGERDL